MRRIALLILILLTFPANAPADPPAVTPVPAPEPEKWVKIDAPAGRLFVLSAEPASKWRIVSRPANVADLRVFENGKYAALVGQSGTTCQMTVTGPSGDVAQIELAFGPQPPGPGPGPPEPMDSLKTRVKAAFDADPVQLDKRRQQAKDLAALYRQLAKVSSDATITTAGDLVTTAQKSAKEMVDIVERDKSGAIVKVTRVLVGIRDEVVSKELGLIFPEDGPLTESQRTSAADLFTRLAKILDEL